MGGKLSEKEWEVRTVEREIWEVYERLVAAFGEGRLDDYFACFADEATLVFHGAPWLGSLEEYRTAWDRWVKEDEFAILAVKTDVMSVQMLGDGAVLTHSIQTRQRTRTGEEALDERETIVFARQPDGRWLVVHQHLSPQPDVAGAAGITRGARWQVEARRP
jgi:uncharacterized protein (TIGR02246 family)